MITDWEVFAVVAAVIVAALAVRSYMPIWAVYALAVGLALERFVHILTHEWSLKNIVGMLVFVSLAVIIWWRDLRGTEDRKESR